MFWHIVLYFLAIFGGVSLVLFTVIFYALNEVGKFLLPVVQGVSEAIGRKYT